MTHPGSGNRSDRKHHRSEIQRASSEALGHGITIAVAIGLFLWLGDRLDGVLGTSPIFALAGILVGAAAGFYRLYAHLMTGRDPSRGADEAGPDRDGSG